MTPTIELGINVLLTGIGMFFTLTGLGIFFYLLGKGIEEAINK